MTQLCPFLYLEIFWHLEADFGKGELMFFINNNDYFRLPHWTEPRKEHFLCDIYQKRKWNKEIRTEIKTKNISFYGLIISFKQYNKLLKRYKIEWKLKQEKQNGN